MRYFLGIDIGKESIKVSVALDISGKLLKAAAFANDARLRRVA